MSDLFKKFVFVKNHIQLLNVSLSELTCSREQGSHTHLTAQFEHRFGRLTDREKISIYLKVSIDFEELGMFRISCTHEGIVAASNELPEEDLEEYLEDQIVPLLLPYARECIASTLARMQVPPYTLPTMDVLQSLAASSEGEAG
ncbi:protein-export chaperone SecB [Cohnella fermenti]|uniref:Preprotein translocase subunit SecB n=1 Tax=Cohnella fermenti TaxID=2565925 RepID=A0A4S4BZU9_9BACL|nr:protein-export chaperone SecB [Cohnella fermenti]THF80815.1 hypothetical protein E6C55_10050 [Cohnella fermenti]